MNAESGLGRNAKAEKVERNLQGQRLGRKGQTTRERIIAAARELIEDPEAEALSISAVARRTELRVSSIYNYFPDVIELFMTVLEPVIEETQTEFLAILQEHWPDEELDERSSAFVDAFYRFWRRNVRLLHLRNAFADQHEPRVLLQRINSARMVVNLLCAQVTGDRNTPLGPELDRASVLYTAIERVVTIASDELLLARYPEQIERRYGDATLVQLARLLELSIRDERERR